jgi:hypothetical protein
MQVCCVARKIPASTILDRRPVLPLLQARLGSGKSFQRDARQLFRVRQLPIPKVCIDGSISDEAMSRGGVLGEYSLYLLQIFDRSLLRIVGSRNAAIVVAVEQSWPIGASGV